MPIKWLLHWQPNAGTTVNSQILTEVSQCVESINGAKGGRWKATLTYYRPILRDQTVQGEYPRDLLGISLQDQPNKYYFIIRNQRIVLESDLTIQTIMEKSQSYKARVSLNFEGFQYQLGDFQLRVGKVVPTHSENLRGIVMESTDLTDMGKKGEQSAITGNRSGENRETNISSENESGSQVLMERAVANMALNQEKMIESLNLLTETISKWKTPPNPPDDSPKSPGQAMGLELESEVLQRNLSCHADVRDTNAQFREYPPGNRFDETPNFNRTFGGGFQYNHRLRNLEFPVFVGENPEYWIARAERYFSINMFTEAEKLAAASIHIDGDAQAWFQWEEGKGSFRSWRELKTLLQRFRSSQMGSPCDRFLAIRQETTVEEYRQTFEVLVAPLPHLSREVQESTFLNGLKPEIQAEVRMLKPEGLEQVMDMAQRVEDRNVRMRATRAAHSGYQRPSSTTFSPTHRPASQTTGGVSSPFITGKIQTTHGRLSRYMARNCFRKIFTWSFYAY